MARVELLKTIEARKMHPRTMRPMTPDWSTVPFGAILDKFTENNGTVEFWYHGEPYQCPEASMKSAYKKLD